MVHVYVYHAENCIHFYTVALPEGAHRLRGKKNEIWE